MDNLILSKTLAAISMEMTRFLSTQPEFELKLAAWRDQLAVAAEQASKQEAELRETRPLLAAAMERLSNQGGTMQ